MVAPFSVAAALDSSVWMTDYTANVVRKLDSHGNTVLVLGSAEAEQPVVFANPNGIAVAPAGDRVYVTEFTNKRVQVFDEGGRRVTQFGSDGTEPGQFKNPVGVAVSAAGDQVYVADNGGSRRIQKFDRNGALVPGFDLRGTAGGVFVGLQDIVVEPAGTLLVMDASSSVALLHRFAADGTHLPPTMDLKPHVGTAKGIALDASGNILVADWGATKRVVRFSPGGSRLDEWSAPGAWDVAVRPDGSAVTVNRATNRLDFWDTSAGAVRLAFSAPVPSTANGVFSRPSSVSYGSDGSIYVADTLNNRVQKLTSAGRHVASETTFGSSSESTLTSPTAVAVEPAGTVLVSTRGTVIRYSADLNYLQDFGAGLVGEVSGIAIGEQQRVFVTDRIKNCVHVFESDGTLAGRWPADDIAGKAVGDLAAPEGIAFAPDKSLWIAESGNKRLQRFSASGTSLGEARYYENGTQVFASPIGVAVSSDGGVWATDAGLHGVVRLTASGVFSELWGGRSGVGPNNFNSPMGIAVGSNGEILVADTGNSRLMRAIPPVSDTTPPEITVSPVPDGWVRGPVSVTLSALDGTTPCEVRYSLNGGVPSTLVSGPVVVSAEGTTTLRYSSKDAAGNEATGSATIRIDKTGPVITHNAPAGWATETVELTMSAADALNTVDRIEYRYLPDGEFREYLEGETILVHATTTIAIRAFDSVGNESSRTIEVSIDSSGVEVLSDYETGEWTTGPVNLNLWASNGAQVYWGIGEEGPVHAYTGSIPIEEEGITVVNFAAEMRPGVLGGTRMVNVCIDRQKPTVRDDAPREPVRGPIVVEIASDDGPVGSQVVYSHYRLNGGGWNPGEAVLVSTEGATLIEYQAVDKVGWESEIGSCTVVIDNTPPAVSHEVPSGWVRGSAVVTLTANEGTIKYSTDGSTPVLQYESPLSIGAQGRTTVKYRGRDTAGNESAIREVSVHVDNDAPIVTTTARPIIEGTATVVVTASDPHSRVAQLRYRLGDGEWVTADSSPSVTTSSLTLPPISVLGSYTLFYEATDALGNVRSDKVEFEIQPAPEPDRAKPVTTASGAPAGWSRALFSVTLSATDESEFTTYYRIGNASEDTTYTKPISFTQDVHTVLHFWTVDAEGNTETTQTVPILIDRTPPGAPAGMSLEGMSATGVRLAWSPAYDAKSGISHYVVTDEAGGTWTVTTPWAQLSGFASGSTKTFAVRAVDRAGNISVLTNLTATLPANEVSAPVALSGTPSQVSIPIESLSGEGAWSGATVAFAQVARAGTLTMSRLPQPPAPPPVQPPKRIFAPGLLVAFDGEAVGRRAVTVPYDPKIPSRRATQLTVMLRAGTQWQTVESFVDTVNHTITFYPSAFSTFWVMEPATTSTAATFVAPAILRTAYGAYARITATLRDSNGEGLTGYRVALERNAGGTWVRVGSMSPVSGSPGKYSLSQKPYGGSRTEYRVVLEATALYTAASAGTVVIPKAKLSRPKTPLTGLRRYKAFYTTGTMAPAHRAPVKLYFERRSSGRWRVQKFVTVTASSTGGYRAKTSLKAGTWRVRATHLDAGHQATTSTWSRTFTVR